MDHTRNCQDEVVNEFLMKTSSLSPPPTLIVVTNDGWTIDKDDNCNEKDEELLTKVESMDNEKERLTHKAYIVGEWLTDDDSISSSTSDDEEWDNGEIAITSSSNILPPLSTCFMARSWQESNEDEDEDDEDEEQPSYDELIHMLEKTHKMILKKNKKIEVVSKEHEVMVF